MIFYFILVFFILLYISQVRNLAYIIKIIKYSYLKLSVMCFKYISDVIALKGSYGNGFLLTKLFKGQLRYK